jgi:hypothetical protein
MIAVAQAPVAYGPILRAMINPTMSHKKRRDQLSFVTLIHRGTVACPHQFPHRFKGFIGRPNWCQLARPQEAREAFRIPPIGFYPLPWTYRDQRGSYDIIGEPKCRDLAIHP